MSFRKKRQRVKAKAKEKKNDVELRQMERCQFDSCTGRNEGCGEAWEKTMKKISTHPPFLL